MKKTINILIIIFLFSCSDASKKETQRTETRNLTVFEFDSLVSKADYELSIRERDSVIIYNYKNINDSTKNKDFRYLKRSDRLLAGPFEFKKTENHHYSTFENFNYYDSDPGIMDGIGPVIFNDEFGVLGFDNGMGTQYYFTNDSIGKIDLPVLYKPTELNVTDNIPQGKFKYEIYFAEFGGRMPNRTCEVEIIGNKIIVTQDKTTNLTGGKIIFEGLILKHKSGKWILADKKEEVNADEIGGCTEIPIIDFEKKLIEWC